MRICISFRILLARPRAKFRGDAKKSKLVELNIFFRLWNYIVFELDETITKWLQNQCCTCREDFENTQHWLNSASIDIKG